MKITYVQQHFATAAGEAGVRGYNLVRTFVERGHDVTVVCGHNWRDISLGGDANRRIEVKDVDGFRLVRIGVYYSNHQGLLARVWSFLAFAILAMREVSRQNSDIVFASSTPLTISLPAVWARWTRGTPYVFEVRDLWPDLPVEMGLITNPLAKKALYWWERLVYRQAWRLVALAPGIKSGIIAKAGTNPGHVIMIPNGSDTENLRPTPPAEPRLLPRNEGEMVLGYTGTFGVANGLDAVLDAAAVLMRRRTSRARFVLVGDGRERRHLESRIRLERLDNVSLVGLVNKRDYNRVLAELDVGLQILKNVPGFRYGTSPNKFFDYLAAGRPVLVNYPGWMSDLVRDNACGVVVAPDNAEVFADAVQALEADQASRVAMGRAARLLAEREFSHQRILVDLARFLEDGFAEMSIGAQSSLGVGSRPS